MTLELAKKCRFNVTPPRLLENVTEKNGMVYYSRHVEAIYLNDPNLYNLACFPDTVVYNHTFEYYGRMRVFVGVSREVAQYIVSKLKDIKANFHLEESNLIPEQKILWVKGQFQVAEINKEYIVMMVEDP